MAASHDTGALTEELILLLTKTDRVSGLCQSAYS